MTGRADVGAEIEIRNVIAIAGRGAVLIGYVRKGLPRIGQLTSPLEFGPAGPRRLEVVAVEKLSSMEAGGRAIGLVFRHPPALQALRLAAPAGASLLLEEPAPAQGASS
jgi:hypothetical protein